MGNKVKAQVAPIAIPAPAMGGQGRSLFADEPSDTMEMETARLDTVAAAEPPPDVQLQHANRFGHHFSQTVVANSDQTHAQKSAIQANADGSFVASQGIEKRLKSHKGGGQPLPPETQNFMESRFENDFSGVRVHTDTEAVQMNRDLRARAFTHGEDIYFNAGQYNPQSQTGKRLLAHELTHTIQQTGAKIKPKRLSNTPQNRVQQKPLKGNAQSLSVQCEYQDEGISLKPLTNFSASSLLNSPIVQAKLRVGAPGDQYEQEADRMADRVVSTDVSVQPQLAPDLSPAHGLQLSHLQSLQSNSCRGEAPSHLAASQQNLIQRNEIEDIERDTAAAAAQIKQELDAKRQEGGNVSAGEEAAKTANEQGQQLEDVSKSANNQETAEQQASSLSTQADQITQQQETKTTETQEENQKTVKQEQQKDEQVAEQEKQKDQTAAENAEPEVDREKVTPETSSSIAAPEGGLLPSENTTEGLTDPGRIQIPDAKADHAPTSAEDDPAFQAVVQQTEHLAAEQSQHKPATDKAREAQDAATDPNQQTRSAQATQTSTASSKTPVAFDREAFINSLIAVLDSNKPKSQEDVEQGKGASGATEGMKQAIAESKQTAGGGLPEAAKAPADPTVEASKSTTPTPDALTEAGEPPTEAIEAEAATPKPKTEQEIEEPLQETATALDELVPQKLQTKLIVGAPGDKYEQEADRMADRVMAMPAPGLMVQLAPGMFIQMESLTAEKPTQDNSEVPIDQNRLELYQSEAGIDVEGPIAEAKEHFTTSAAQEYRTAETEIHQDTQQQQTQTNDQAHQEMFATRQQEFQNVQGTQTVAQQQDETERARISQEVQAIYNQTKTNVDTILTRMDQRVEAEFAATNALARQRFEATQKQLFKAWKQDYYYQRHPLWLPAMKVKVGWAYVKVRFYMERYFNTPLWLTNKVFTGLPDEVNQIYVKAREVFVEEQKKGVYRIADIVEQELANAKVAVDQGRQQVTDYVNGLPDNLKAIGTEAAASVQSQFDQLEQTIQNHQQQLVDKLKTKYEESLKEIDQRIAELKAKNQGFVSKALKALSKLATWILRQIISVLKPWLEKIPGIGSQVGKFLDAFADNPGKFMSNLFKGIGEGFKNFAKNALTHLKTAVFTWLFNAGIDIKLPSSFDLKGILDFVLQVLGLTKDYIFELAGNFFPDWALELINLILEKGASAFSEIEELLTDLGVPEFVFGFFKAFLRFPAEGFIAIWDFIKGFLANLKIDFVLTLIQDLLMPELVVAGIQWLLGLLVPGAGILKIVKAVVDVISFFINNIDTIKTILEAIGATLDAVISGAVGMIASAVEQAIVSILPTVLGLLATLLGLGGIPQKISKVLQKLRAPVEEGLGKIFSTIGGLMPGGKKGKKGQHDKPEKDDPKKRLKAASNEVQGLTRRVRDPDAVEAKLGSIQKRHKLTSLELKKSGKKQYQVVGQAKPIKGSTTVQRQAIASTQALPNLEPQTEHGIQRAEGKGKAMPDSLRSQMESSFEQDFSNVRLHTNAEADRLSRSLDAKAFTVGQDIFFRQGAYNPQQPEGKRLLAHELTHVTQQRYGLSTPPVQRKAVNWNDKKNTITVKKKLKGSKQSGGKFTVTAKLMDASKVLPKVAQKLKAFIKRNPDLKRVRLKLRELKAQYNLKSLYLIPLDKTGTRYQIKGTAPAEGQGTVQRSPQSGATPMTMEGGIETAIQRAQEHGQPLSMGVRQPLENAFGIDFGTVRIHTDVESDRLNRSLQAHAFTTGQDIFFRQGIYNPSSRSGKHLLAHELTHVVQQAGETPAMTASTQGFFPDIQRQRHDGLGSGRSQRPQIQRLAVSGASLLGSGLFNSEDKVDIDKRVTKSTLWMNVTVEKARKSEGKKSGKSKPSNGLPPELINDIVKVVQGIVNQDPNPDVVSQKLDKVRAEFGLDLVKLAAYAMIRDSYEYTIKIKGSVKGMDEAAVANFLKRLGGGKPKADEIKNNAFASEDQQNDNKQDNLEQGDRSFQNTKLTQEAKKSAQPETKSKLTNQLTTSQEESPEMDQEARNDNSNRIKDFDEQSDDRNQQDQKNENNHQSEIDINTTVRRIDEQSVDLIVRSYSRNAGKPTTSGSNSTY
jgi:hypothetical protein